MHTVVRSASHQVWLVWQAVVALPFLCCVVSCCVHACICGMSVAEYACAIYICVSRHIYAHACPSGIEVVLAAISSAIDVDWPFHESLYGICVLVWVRM